MSQGNDYLMNIFIPTHRYQDNKDLLRSVGISGFTAREIYTPPGASFAESVNRCLQAATDRYFICVAATTHINRRVLEYYIGQLENGYRYVFFVNSELILIDLWYLQKVGMFDSEFKSRDFACCDMALRFNEKHFAVCEGILARGSCHDRYTTPSADLAVFRNKWRSYKNGFGRLTEEKSNPFKYVSTRKIIRPFVHNSDISVFHDTDNSWVSLNACNINSEFAQQRIETMVKRASEFMVR